jgi:hypothetical protein
MRMLLDPDASIFSFLELPPRPTYGYGGVGGGGGSGPLPNLSRFGSLLVRACSACVDGLAFSPLLPIAHPVFRSVF